MSQPPEPAPRSPADDVGFFGHPKGLGYLVAAEAGWAFAYYGMITILTLYMTERLFTPGHIEHIWGFGAYSTAMQALFGTMTPLALASQTFGLVTGLVYATPILGGLIGDRWLGQRRVVAIGLVVLAAGHAILVSERGFLIGMALLVVGGGLVKSNLLGQIGRLYAPDDPRRTRAFGLFLIAVNVGGFVTPLVVGTLGEKVGWAQGFTAAAVGMGLSLAIYLAGWRHMPRDGVRTPRADRTPTAKPRLADARVIGALLLILVAEVLNVGAYNQAFNIFPVWAKAHVDLNLLGFEMPVTWFSTLDGVLTIAATALAVRFWAAQSKRGVEPRETTRIAIGCAMTMGAFLTLALGSLMAMGGKVAIVAPIAFFILADGALPWVDTVIMALISRAAPASLTTTMLGVYYLSFAAGNFLVGALGRLYETMDPAAFWAVHAALVGAALAFLAIFGGGMNRLLTPSPLAPGEARGRSEP